MQQLTEDAIAASLAGLAAAPPCAVDIAGAVAKGRRLRRRRAQRRAFAGAVAIGAVAAGTVAVPSLTGATRGSHDISAASRATGHLRLLAFTPAGATSEREDFTATAVPGTDGACISITYQGRQLPGLPCAAASNWYNAFVHQDGLLYGFVWSGADQVDARTTEGDFVSDPVAVLGTTRLRAFVLTIHGTLLSAGYSARSAPPWRPPVEGPPSPSIYVNGR